MQYTVNRGDKGKVEIKVDIEKAEFAKAYEEMLDVLGKDVKVEGFRPGYVPRDVLEGKVGANKILNEAASFLASKHLSEIFKKEGLLPLGNPAIAVSTLAKDSPFAFVANIISKPKVKVGNWKIVKVKKLPAKEVTEKDVEESIKNIHEAWKKQKRTTDKEQLTTDTNEEKPDEQSGKFIYDAHGNKIPIKEDGSPSSHKATKGDSSEGINDNFAKAIGARDLAHLREIVKKDLEQIVGDQIEAKAEEEIFEEVLKISEVEVPDILVDDEVNRMMVRLNQTLEQQGRKIDDYLREQNTTLDALRAKFRGQAEKNVKVTLVMDEIGRAESVKVEPADVETALKGVDQTKLTDDQKRDLENYMAVSLFQAKTLDLVKKAVASS